MNKLIEIRKHKSFWSTKETQYMYILTVYTCVLLYACWQDTCAAEKNELLFSEFGINYNKLPQLYRKGTTLIWQSTQPKDTTEGTQLIDNTEREPGSGPITNKQLKPEILVLNVDIIGEQFWKEHPHILT